MARRTTQRKKICPFTVDPLEECYFIKGGKDYATPVIYYCSGKFEECDLYRKKMIDRRERHEVSVFRTMGCLEL